jgi:hypothetical protein
VQIKAKKGHGDMEIKLRPALSDFLRSAGSGTGFTQPREDN